MEGLAFLNPFLRVIHIVAAALWAGGAFTTTLMIVPAQQLAGKAGVAFTRALYGQTAFGRAFGIVGALTVIAGLLLYATGSWQHFSQTGNIVLGIGAVAGLLAAGHGAAVGKISEAFYQASLKVETDPQSENVAALEATAARLKRNAVISFAIVMVALVFMASARYL